MWYEAWKGYISGVLSGHIKRSGVLVLCYHGVVAEKKDPRLERNLHLLSDFRNHVRLLKKLKVMPLAALVEDSHRLQSSKKLSVFITFDDGYANNLRAHEILNDAGLPSAVFVSTATLAKECTIWTVELSLLLLHGRGNKLEVFDNVYSLGSRLERETAFQDIRCALKRLPQALKNEVMNAIRAQFPEGETERLLEDFPSLKLMNWEELSKLKNIGVEIGSHGVHHEIHHAAQPRDVRLLELSESKRTLEQNLGHTCRFFAFPNGDYCEASATELREAGYELGFTLQQGPQSGSADNIIHRLTPPSAIRSFVRQLLWRERH